MMGSAVLDADIGGGCAGPTLKWAPTALQAQILTAAPPRRYRRNIPLPWAPARSEAAPGGRSRGRPGSSGERRRAVGVARGPAGDRRQPQAGAAAAQAAGLRPSR